MRALVMPILLIAASVHAQEAVRQVLPLDHGWRFLLDGAAGAQEPFFDDSRWQPVEVPHTWNRLGNVGVTRSTESNSVQGQGWYRLHFSAPAGAKTDRYFLQFDAVSTVAQVWLNGHSLGRHAGAFARFRFDATEAIHPGTDNVLVVAADNSRPVPGSSTQDVIPLGGDFFMFGGIYRGVALIVTHEAHIDLMDYGGPGLYVRTLKLEGSRAHMQLSARLVDEARASQMLAEFLIEDAQGRTVAARAVRVSAGPSPEVVKADFKMNRIRRWQGTQDPYLYRAIVTLRTPGGEASDRVEQRFGLREMRFDPDRGFFLNGARWQLKGVSRHQDRPVKGWAISREDQRQDFDLMQDMGANAVRLAHYQHDQASYELADERGFVVWAEIPLVNKVSHDGTPANLGLSTNAKQQLKELIRQNYNHPSIAAWSVANEVDLTATLTKGPSRPASLLQSLNELAHSEDLSRATVLADCCETGLPPRRGAEPENPQRRDAIAGITDILGYNRYFGWYTGSFVDLGAMLDAAHRAHPSLPLAVSEYGAGAALTQHSDDARGGPINPHGRPHPEEYQNLYHEASWPQIRSRPFLWASFIWNMFDFSSDSRREGDLTDINEKGVVSYDRRTLKDSYFYYRANWNTAPTLHLTERRHELRDYAVIDVKAYSNAASARLTLNGAALGETTCVDGICVWPAVKLRQGRNEIAASAEVGGLPLNDAVTFTLDHSPAVVRIKAGDISGYTCADGARFGSDLYFEGGDSGSINPPDTPEASRKAVRAADSDLYGTYREGEFLYHVPVPDGHYRVTLKFVEPTAGKGERTFSVRANGMPLLDQFDVFAAAGGTLRGIDKGFEVEAKGGLTLKFMPQRGPALVSALSIAPM